MPDPGELVAKLAACGVGRDTAVVAYDDSRLAFASRLWWLMRSLGYKPPRLLNGGYKAFLAAGGQPDTGVPVPEGCAALSVAEFQGFCDGAITEEQIINILNDPTNAPLPKKLGDQYSLISYICAQASVAANRKAAGILINRFSPELGVLLARDMLKANPTFATDKGFLQFVTEHKDFIT